MSQSNAPLNPECGDRLTPEVRAAREQVVAALHEFHETVAQAHETSKDEQVGYVHVVADTLNAAMQSGNAEALATLCAQFYAIIRTMQDEAKREMKYRWN